MAIIPNNENIQMFRQLKKEVKELREIVYLLVRSKLDPDNVDLLIDVENRLANLELQNENTEIQNESTDRRMIRTHNPVLWTRGR